MEISDVSFVPYDCSQIAVAQTACARPDTCRLDVVTVDACRPIWNNNAYAYAKLACHTVKGYYQRSVIKDC